MFHSKIILATLLFVFCVSPAWCADKVSKSSDAEEWTLECGPNRLVLSKVGDAVVLTHLGPEAAAPLKQSSIVSASVGGKYRRPCDWKVQGVRVLQDASKKIKTIEVSLTDSKAQLDSIVQYSAWANTGVFSCDIRFVNRGAKAVSIGNCSSLAIQLQTKNAKLRYLDGPRGVERQMKAIKLEKESFRLDNKLKGRSTQNKSSWWSVYLPKSKYSYTSQLAYSGNWEATFALKSDGVLGIKYGMIFDNEGALKLPPGNSFVLPRAVIAVTKGRNIGPAVRAMHSFQRQFIIPKSPANDPLLVQYNTWYPFGGDISAEKINQLIPLAADIGCEAFVIDANWHYCPGNDSRVWSKNLGDWVVNPKKFPNGLAPIIKSVHERGMRFGIWLEPETVSLGSNVYQKHPEWLLTYKGKPIEVGNRAHLDFALPEVRYHMHSVIERLMNAGKIDWVKLDYNINIGNKFDSASDHSINTRLHDHLAGYYTWLDELRKKYPEMVIEHCSSGGRRADLATIEHSHTGWISDTVNPRFSVQVGYGALIEFPPEICNHWMVGDTPANQRAGHGEITTTDPDWWDFMFRIAMNGQFGVSSRLDLWPKAAFDRAKENIQLYKRIRKVIYGAEVYHLTKAPAAGENPKGWMGIHYVQPDQKRSVLMAYRLGESEASHSFQLQGLDAKQLYSVTFGGRLLGTHSGSYLADKGIELHLDKSWNSKVVELSVVDSME